MKIRRDAPEIPRKNPNPPDERMVAEFPKESRWQAMVEKWFKQMGWTTYHTWGSMHSKAGFPDLVAVLPGVALIWAEFKTEKGTVTEEQEEWLLMLARTGQDVFLWRPSDTDEIQQLLQDCHVLSNQFLSS